MRFAVAHIIYEDWKKDMRNERDRKALLKDILNRLAKETPKVHLLVLPAGFIWTKRVRDCEPIANRVIRSLPDKHPAIAFGIDCRPSNNGSDKNESNSPPYFGYAVSHKGEKLVWNHRQQGTCSKHRINGKDLNSSERIFKVSNKKIAFIICGEITTKALKSNGLRLPEYISKEKDIDLFIDIAHGDKKIKPYGRSWFPAMKSTGKPCVISEHIGRYYKSNGLYCENSKLGPDYSYKVKKPKSIRMDKYYLKVYDLP